MDIDKIVSELSQEEKVALLSGADFWTTVSVERLGIKPMLLQDGPHGLRKLVDVTPEMEAAHQSHPAVCFPAGCALASSWDRELIAELGSMLGQTARAEGVWVLLGPAINIKRSPLCGRNFEYMSEDPYLAGELAAAYIRAVQAEGVGTSVKHYAANNQEFRRMTTDEIIDERALREIYLAGFEIAVKKGRPWTVMAAYNKVNGSFCTENEYLLSHILRDEWGFDGFVMSDWGAVNDIVAAVKAGLELEMPGTFGTGPAKLLAALREGRLDETVLDRAVSRILDVQNRVLSAKKDAVSYDKEEQHKAARRIASECMVLLKNNNNLLPLETVSAVAFIGAFARNVRYQGGGSSNINATKVDSLVDEFSAISSSSVSFAEGYTIDDNCSQTEKQLIEAVECAKQAEVAVVCVGLPETWESECYDRPHMKLPESHNRLVEEVAKVCSKTVVVLFNGAPVEMPWIDKVDAVLEAYLGGQAAGGAAADILTGKVNPSGKLAETFPVLLEHNPAHLYFPGEGDKSVYGESIFVGYRYYDSKKIAPLFPFGHGLSYTSFDYQSIETSAEEIKEEEKLIVRIRICNTGSRAGKETVQLYVSDPQSSVRRPEKELKGFEKIFLESGESKTVEFVLDRRAFAYYEPAISDWRVESGDFIIMAGASSQDIRLTKKIRVISDFVMPPAFTPNSTIGDLLAHPYARSAGERIKKDLLSEGGPMYPLWVKNRRMAEALLEDLPLRNLIAFSGGQFSPEDLDNMLTALNSTKEQ
ncbi:glycoside hydrolase family 3 C-terminal domain-containing protein [Spirochaetia bacterium 38H-sp]|uniref:Glycoside hydrolase family 3 C-terminal domain-containing protein n=1 Tax=Rarispira pelagica TaxID=3141764 RepID=A0ABU9UCH5_9SPIR